MLHNGITMNNEHALILWGLLEFCDGVQEEGIVTAELKEGKCKLFRSKCDQSFQMGGQRMNN